MNKRLAVTLWFTCIALLALPLFVLAQAAGLPDPSDNLAAFLTAALVAVKGGDWQVVAALALVGVVFLLRKFGTKLPWIGAFLATSSGGTVLAVVTVIGTGLAAAWYVHTPITVSLLGTLVVAAWSAIGAWTGLRRLLSLLAKLPGAVGKLFAGLLSLLGGDPAAQVQDAADSAKTSTPPTAPGSSVATGLDSK